MSVRVTVAVVDEFADNAAETLRLIADQLEEGFTSGYDSAEGRHYVYEVTQEDQVATP